MVMLWLFASIASLLQCIVCNRSCRKVGCAYLMPDYLVEMAFPKEPKSLSRGKEE